MILDDFFAAAAAFDDGRRSPRVMHPDVRFSEMPNAINPRGTERDREAARAGFARGPRDAARAQTYDVHCSVVAGDTIAARATWRGTLAATGQELTAHIATFTQVRDGKIFRHATYDCYESSTL